MMKKLSITFIAVCTASAVFAQAKERVKAGVGYAASATTTPAEFVFEQAPGNELISNGTFGTTNNWTLGAKWAIGGGVATYTATNEVAVTSAMYQASLTLTSNKQYRLTYTISGVDADTGYAMTPSIGNSAYTTRTADGTYTEDVYYAGDAKLTFTVVSTNATTNAIDNVKLMQKPADAWVDTLDLITTNGAGAVHFLLNCNANDFTNAYNAGRTLQVKDRAGQPLVISSDKEYPIYNMWYRTAADTETLIINAR